MADKFEKFHHITFGELLEIKKILSMTYKDGLQASIDLKHKHNLTDNETKNLIHIAKKFKPQLIILEKV